VDIVKLNSDQSSLFRERALNEAIDVLHVAIHEIREALFFGEERKIQVCLVLAGVSTENAGRLIQEART
jgi:hypothetical protein